MLYLRYGFNGQEKDDDIADAGNTMTAEFWEYDTRLGRRYNIDPKPNPWESVYSTFGGNPILRVDILGDKWKDKVNDQKVADETIGAIKQKQGKYEKRMNKMQERVAKAIRNGNSDKAQEYMKKYDQAKDGRDNLQNAINEINIMGDDNTPQEFTFNKLSGANEGVLSFTKNSDGSSTTVINYLNRSNLVHELKHAHQTLTGQLEGIPGTDRSLYHDITDEQEAYIRQFFFDSNSMPHSNPAARPGLQAPSSSEIYVNKPQDINILFMRNIYTTIKGATGFISVDKANIYKDTKSDTRIDKP